MKDELVLASTFHRPIFRALCLLLPLSLAAPAHAELETMAKHAYLIDMNTHTVLLSKDATLPMAPSSMSKLMTTYVLFQRMKAGRIKPTDMFTISEKAWRTQGSKSFVPIGQQISVEDLIHGIIVQSGNDACIVVAENVSGSEEAFVKELNRVAAEIGLEHSHFMNATGLPEDGHVMSAHDLALLAERLLLDFPEYYHYFSIPEYTYNNIRQQNRNRLLIRGIGVDGLKTGHAEEAGYGITLSAKQGDRRLILVLNGLPDDKARVEEGDKILRYGFREFENKTLLKKGQEVGQAEVWFGAKAQVPLITAEEMVATLPITPQPKKVSMVLKYNAPLPAPIEAGTHVADLVVTLPGQEPRTIALNTAARVERANFTNRILAVIRHYTGGAQ